MAERNLIVEDEFVQSAANNSSSYGTQLDGIINRYITTLEEIKSEAITSGEIANALDSFIEAAKLVQNELSSTSNSVDKDLNSYLGEINTADSYLF